MSVSWGDFAGPTHQDEVMTAHEGAPSVAEQAVTHGAGLPVADTGMSEAEKYGGSGGYLPAAC